MTPTRTILFILTLIALSLTGCAYLREQSYRNAYLATGRAPTGWVPKESLCPAFARNGWQNHPPAPSCFKPPAKVATKQDVEFCRLAFPVDARKAEACVNDRAR